MALFGVVNGALNGAARRMAHDGNYLGPSQFAGKLHTAKDIGIFDIACDATIEDVPDAEIQDRLGRCSRVNAGKQHRSRVLTLGAGALLSQEIVVFTLAGVKALV